MTAPSSSPRTPTASPAAPVTHPEPPTMSARSYFAMKRQGVALWSVRSGEFDPLRAVLEGERSTDESDRKSGLDP